MRLHRQLLTPQHSSFFFFSSRIQHIEVRAQRSVASFGKTDQAPSTSSMLDRSTASSSNESRRMLPRNLAQGSLRDGTQGCFKIVINSWGQRGEHLEAQLPSECPECLLFPLSIVLTGPIVSPQQCSLSCTNRDQARVSVSVASMHFVEI